MSEKICGLYYHPDRIIKDIVFIDAFHHEITLHFLTRVEELVPELLDDLSKIIPTYKKAMQRIKWKQQLEVTDWPSEWTNLLVSERLGHASITLTLDTYSHVLPDMQQKAAEKL